MKILGWCLVTIGAFAGASLTDLISEEVRSQLDRVPRAVLRLAASRLPACHRVNYFEEWCGELHEFLHGAEARPITRLVKGTRYALGIVWSTRAVRQILAARPNLTPAPRTPGLGRGVGQLEFVIDDRTWIVGTSSSGKRELRVRWDANGELDADGEMTVCDLHASVSVNGLIRAIENDPELFISTGLRGMRGH